MFSHDSKQPWEMSCGCLLFYTTVAQGDANAGSQGDANAGIESAVLLPDSPSRRLSGKF